MSINELNQPCTYTPTASPNEIPQTETPIGEKSPVVIAFPDEIILEIFSYLALKDITHCAQTDKQWHRVSETPQIWKAFFQRDFPWFPKHNSQVSVTKKNYRTQFLTMQNMHKGSVQNKKTLQGFVGLVNLAIFSPDSQTILTAASDGTARFSDLTGKQVALLQGNTEPLISATFSASGKTLVTTSLNRTTLNRTTSVWDLTGKQTMLLQRDAKSSKSIFSPDGKIMFTRSIYDKNTILLWSRTDEKIAGRLPIHTKIADLTGHTQLVIGVTFSPDSKIVATTSADATVRLWDLRGRQIAQLQDHAKAVLCTAFSPNGRFLVTGSDDRTVRLWDFSPTLEEDSEAANV